MVEDNPAKIADAQDALIAMEGLYNEAIAKVAELQDEIKLLKTHPVVLGLGREIHSIELRDLFAMAVLPQSVKQVDEILQVLSKSERTTMGELVEVMFTTCGQCYGWADAMLEARKR